MLDNGDFAFAGMTLGEARQTLVRCLAAANREPAALDARLLLEVASGLNHAALLRDDSLRLEADAAMRLTVVARRRIAGEPLSRILGHREFAGLTLQVRPHVLDPREDTQTLVQLASRLRPDRGGVARILDLGTGSGALLCALLALYPSAAGIGIDFSMAACLSARANLEANRLAARGNIVRGDWSAPVDGPFDLIVSNPPYIRSGDLAHLPDEVRDHDPELALDGGADGFDAYRSILACIGRISAPGALLVLEFGVGMGPTLTDLLLDAGLTAVGSQKDVAGHVRAFAAQMP